jgi:tRNA threonylcarbamoyladenosine biosynthesis protein TsaE
MQKISKSLKETEKIAKDFSQKILKKNRDMACVVCLSGDLGTGKTTFTQSFAKNLGIKRKVNSPTFVIMKRYPLFENSFSFKNFVHIDAYRLKDEKELLVLGWEEIISNKENLIFIEWPEKIIKAIPKKHHKIKISHTKEGYRKFTI